MQPRNLFEIINFLNNYLKISEIDDYSLNGLQVEGKKNIQKVITAVDASEEIFKIAKKENAELIFVHHGMLWKSINSITGINYKRMKILINNKISLYACHLPLDKHEEVGNNIQFLKIFKIIKNITPFGNYHGINIGYKGEFEEEHNLNEFVKEINEKLNTKCKILKFGNKKIKSVGVVSGAASEIVNEAIEEVDCFVTGESSHQVYHLAKEGKINVIFAGHYATETLGVKAIANLIKEKFNIETKFIDIPTNM